MSTWVPQRGTVKIGLYFFGFFGGLVYATQMIPALLGHPMERQAGPGVVAVSVAYGYWLWVHRGRKGWQGALVGLGVSAVVWVAGILISGVAPAH